MARATFVKKARKDVPGTDIKAGESYYWWAFMQGGRGGPKRYSRTAPKRSQLTQSEFYGRLFDLQDHVEGLDATGNDAESLKSECDDIAEQLRELGQEQTDKFDNLPENFQNGSTGEQLTERAEWCDSQADEFEQIDFDDFEPGDEWELPEADEGESEEDYNERCDEEKREHGEAEDQRKTEWLEEKLAEIQNIDLSSPN